MDCPVCKNVKLMMADRQGIEIDYCPNYRGVWLDRGELDKIIDRSAGLTSQPAPPQPQARQDPYQGQQYQPQGFGHSQHGHYKKKKREGFLGDLFDFD